nr:hypothetical protein [Sporomusa silvacetica]
MFIFFDILNDSSVITQDGAVLSMKPFNNRQFHRNLLSSNLTKIKIPQNDGHFMLIIICGIFLKTELIKRTVTIK